MKTTITYTPYNRRFICQCGEVFRYFKPMCKDSLDMNTCPFHDYICPNCGYTGLYVGERGRYKTITTKFGFFSFKRSIEERVWEPWAGRKI